VGRPSKLTPETQARIVEALEKGATYDTAAQIAGICEKTFYTWCNKGAQQKTGRYAQFLQAVKGARGSFKEVVHSALYTLIQEGDRGAVFFAAERMCGFQKDGAREGALPTGGQAGGARPNLATKAGREAAVRNLQELPPSMLREALRRAKGGEEAEGDA